MKRILIIDAMLPQSIALAKFIKKYSDFHVTGFITQPHVKLKYCDEVLTEYDKINFDSYDFVVPTGARSTCNLLSKFQKLEFRNGIIFKKENLLAFDKPVMLKICQSIGINIPKTYYKKEEIKEFPVFFKKRYENGDTNIRGVAKKVDDIPDAEALMFQEYIQTPCVYSVCFLAKNGKILTYFLHKEVISHPADGGSAVLIEKYDDNILLEKTKKLLEYLGYDGWGLAEFKYSDIYNDYIFMEVNSKFWASLEFALLNNSKFLKLLFDIDYECKEVKKLLYINRMLANGIFFTLRRVYLLFFSKIIIERSILRQMITKIFPKCVKNMIKQYVKF